jgi:hypothetical protein
VLRDRRVVSFLLDWGKSGHATGHMPCVDGGFTAAGYSTDGTLKSP